MFEGLGIRIVYETKEHSNLFYESEKQNCEIGKVRNI